jgi:cytochrome P450
MRLLAGIWPRPRRRAVDLAAPDVAIDPFPHYEALRAGGPVQYLPAHEFWIVLGYDAVKEAFGQPSIFSNAPYGGIDSVLLAADPPLHAPVRRLLSRFFSSEALDRVAAAAAAAARALIAPEMDVVGDYGFPLTRAVAAELIGFDEADLADLAASESASAAAPMPLDALIAALDRLAPRAALFPKLLAGSDGLLAEEEAASLIRLLWLATTTTTERVITRSILRLLQHPGVRSEVTADRSLLPAFIDEVMRLHPPEHMVPRLTTARFTLAGVDIPAGAPVHLCVSAANRDPARFEAPSEIRLDRPPRSHFAFGRGIHQCLGAPLARRVVAGAIGAILDRAPDFRAAQPLSGIPWFRTITALCPERLVIRLD